VPFGMDVVAFRLDRGRGLVEQWRVQIIGHDLRIKISPDGTKREFRGRGNFPASETDEILQLRPSLDQRQLDVIRWLFDRFATEATNFNVIARQLNDMKAPCPAYAGEWRYYYVREILRNPAYIGCPAWNRH